MKPAQNDIGHHINGQLQQLCRTIGRLGLEGNDNWYWITGTIHLDHRVELDPNATAHTSHDSCVHRWPVLIMGINSDSKMACVRGKITLGLSMTSFHILYQVCVLWLFSHNYTAHKILCYCRERAMNLGQSPDQSHRVWSDSRLSSDPDLHLDCRHGLGSGP